MSACQKCTHPALQLICSSCGTIQPPRPRDAFETLGVPRRVDLADTELEGKYRELQRKLHPDRYARAPVHERVLSLNATTSLNHAYKLLRSPVTRAEALLAAFGVTIGDNESISSEFLVDIMELREQLDDAKAAGDAAAVARLGEEGRRRRQAALDAVAERLAAPAPTGDAAPDAAALADAKAHLIAVRYFDRLIEAAQGNHAQG